MELRNVMFKKWVDAVECEKVYGHWEKDYINPGLFHTWAAKFNKTHTGFHNYTVAIVECPDGNIYEVFPENLKFVVS